MRNRRGLGFSRRSFLAGTGSLLAGTDSFMANNGSLLAAVDAVSRIPSHACPPRTSGGGHDGHGSPWPTPLVDEGPKRTVIALGAERLATTAVER